MFGRGGASMNWSGPLLCATRSISGRDFRWSLKREHRRHEVLAFRSERLDVQVRSASCSVLQHRGHGISTQALRASQHQFATSAPSLEQLVSSASRVVSRPSCLSGVLLTHGWIVGRSTATQPPGSSAQPRVRPRSVRAGYSMLRRAVLGPDRGGSGTNRPSNRPHALNSLARTALEGRCRRTAAGALREFMNLL